MHLHHLKRIARNQQKRDDFDAEQYLKFGNWDGMYECDGCGVMTNVLEEMLCARCYGEQADTVYSDDDWHEISDAGVLLT